MIQIVHHYTCRHIQMVTRLVCISFSKGENKAFDSEIKVFLDTLHILKHNFPQNVASTLKGEIKDIWC